MASEPKTERKPAQSGSRENRGACDACKRVYFWLGAPLLARAACPAHSTPLRRVRRGDRFEHVNLKPIVQAKPRLRVTCKGCGAELRSGVACVDCADEADLRRSAAS